MNIGHFIKSAPSASSENMRRCLMQRRTRRILGLGVVLTILLTASWLSVAAAANVYVYQGSTLLSTYTLSSLSVDSSGNVTCNVASSGGGGGGTTYQVTPYAGTGGTISPSSPVTVNSGSTTSFSVYPASGYTVGSVSGCGGTWTGSNPYITGAINSNCSVTASFTATGGGGGGTDNCTLLTNDVAVRNVSIGANSNLCYKFVLTSTTYAVQVSMGTQDWTTNQDMFVEKGSVPTITDYNNLISSTSTTGNGPTYWYAFSGDSNETFYMWSVPAATYYIFVHNSSSSGGKFELMYGTF